MEQNFKLCIHQRLQPDMRWRRQTSTQAGQNFYRLNTIEPISLSCEEIGLTVVQTTPGKTHCINLSIYLSIYLSIHPSIYISIFNICLCFLYFCIITIYFIIGASTKHRFFYCIEAERLKVKGIDLGNVYGLEDAAGEGSDLVQGFEKMRSIKRKIHDKILEQHRVSEGEKRKRIANKLANAREIRAKTEQKGGTELI
jgi:hypothetical protein